MYCISRIEQRGSLRWQAAIWRQGLRLCKTFSVARHGSAEQALALARQWRDSVLERMPPATRRQFSTRLRKSNKSGVPGVSRKVNTGRAGWPKPHWKSCCSSVSRKVGHASQPAAARANFTEDRPMRASAQPHPSDRAVHVNRSNSPTRASSSST